MSTAAVSWVYPRVCGGTSARLIGKAHCRMPVYPRVCGGTHQVPEGASATNGSIPACAGEPADISPGVCHRPVYPRVCGGTALTLRFYPRPVGSIPACAGEPAHSCHLWDHSGSIPACAGEPAS